MTSITCSGLVTTWFMCWIAALVIHIRFPMLHPSTPPNIYARKLMCSSTGNPLWVLQQQHHHSIDLPSRMQHVLMHVACGAFHTRTVHFTVSHTTNDPPIIQKKNSAHYVGYLLTARIGYYTIHKFVGNRGVNISLYFSVRLTSYNRAQSQRPQSTFQLHIHLLIL